MLLYQKLPPSIARIEVSCRVDYLSAKPNSDSSPRSPGTVSWHDPFSSPSSTWVGSYTRSLGGYFEQIKEEWDDLGNPRSDVSMPSPHVVHWLWSASQDDFYVVVWILWYDFFYFGIMKWSKLIYSAYRGSGGFRIQSKQELISRLDKYFYIHFSSIFDNILWNLACACHSKTAI